MQLLLESVISVLYIVPPNVLFCLVMYWQPFPSNIVVSRSYIFSCPCPSFPRPAICFLLGLQWLQPPICDVVAPKVSFSLY
uniref:Uncharacterized protein n=1 Tax=Triticum urartu TaxID=4572 RepID=A0A8R7PBZ6_TRIUA